MDTVTLKTKLRAYCVKCGLRYQGKWDGEHWAFKRDDDGAMGTLYRLDLETIKENGLFEV